MKNSIDYLPQNKQRELLFLVGEIKKRLPQTEMIILYGSYARNNYVLRGIRVEEPGYPSIKISDYDILVVTSKINNGKAEVALHEVSQVFFQGKDDERDTPVEFITDDIKKLNKFLDEGRYFYTQIIEEGVILYDSGNYKLAGTRELNFEEIQKQAQEYFDEKFQSANEFLLGAGFYHEQKMYKKSAFLLHQATENYYYAIRLAFTLRNAKQHNLSKLITSVKRYSEDLATVFSTDTPEEKRLFNLLKASYVDARYNPRFAVTQEDIEALVPKVERLRDITLHICEIKIKEYGENK